MTTTIQADLPITVGGKTDTLANQLTAALDFYTPSTGADKFCLFRVQLACAKAFENNGTIELADDLVVWLCGALGIESLG